MSFEVTIKSPGKLEPFKVEITAENTVEEILDKCKEHLTDLNDKESIFIILKGKMLNTDQKYNRFKWKIIIIIENYLHHYNKLKYFNYYLSFILSNIRQMQRTLNRPEW